MKLQQSNNLSFLCFVFELVLQMVMTFSSETKLTEEVWKQKEYIFQFGLMAFYQKYHIYFISYLSHILHPFLHYTIGICNEANWICRRKVSSLGPFLTFQDFTNLSEEGRGLIPQGSVNFFYKFGTELETYTCFAMTSVSASAHRNPYL